MQVNAHAAKPGSAGKAQQQISVGAKAKTLIAAQTSGKRLPYKQCYNLALSHTNVHVSIHICHFFTSPVQACRTVLSNSLLMSQEVPDV